MRTLLLITTILFSQIVNASDPLQRASEAYLKNGVDAFIPELLKGSPLEGEKSALTQSNSIRQIEEYYGAYKGYELISEKNLTDSVRIVYYVMNYDKSAVFGAATYYKQTKGEVVTNFNFHTNIWEIIPPQVIFK
ncbi:MAG: hypothetical protein ACRBHB_12340 [Arenicella sp.]